MLHFSLKFCCNYSSLSGDVKTFCVNITYFHQFSSLFWIFWHFFVTKKLMPSAFNLKLIPQKKRPSKSRPLLGLRSARCVYARKYCQILYTNLCVDFFPIWKYQEEIYSTLPKKLVLNRGFWSLLWKLLIMYFPDIFHTFLNMTLLLVTWCNYAAQLHPSLHICDVYICKSSSH